MRENRTSGTVRGALGDRRSYRENQNSMYSKATKNIAILNLAAFSLCIVLFMVFGNKPGPIHPILIIPLFYFLFGFIPVTLGLICSLLAAIKKDKNSAFWFGTITNAIFIVPYILFLWALSNGYVTT